MGGAPLSRTLQQQLAQFLESVIEASKVDLKVKSCLPLPPPQTIFGNALWIRVGIHVGWPACPQSCRSRHYM